MEGPVPTLHTSGHVLPTQEEYAVEKVTGLYRIAHKPVIFTSIRLIHEANPKIERPCIAEANLDVSGEQVRGHVAAETMHEAIDLLEQRLRRQLKRASERLITLHRRTNGEKRPQTVEWRHGDEPTQRPAYFARDAEERELVRRKAFNIHAMRPDEAAFDMEQLDHDFYLFTNIDTDEENTLVRHPGEAYELIQLRKRMEPHEASAVQVRVSESVPPEVEVDEATQLLDEANKSFLFFLNSGTGKGNIVYRRYDGHYGLILPGGG